MDEAAVSYLKITGELGLWHPETLGQMYWATGLRHDFELSMAEALGDNV